MITDNVMKAEFCRQIGEMESAKVILDNTVVDDDYLKGIVPPYGSGWRPTTAKCL